MRSLPCSMLFPVAVLAVLVAALPGCEAGSVGLSDTTAPDAHAEVVFPDGHATDAPAPDATEETDPGSDTSEDEIDAVPTEAEAAGEAEAETPELVDDPATDPSDATEAEDDEAEGGESDVGPTDVGLPETTPSCVPADDGVLEAADVPVLVGAVVSYRVNAVGAVVAVPSLAGSPCPAGLCWDFSAPQAGDTVEADPVRAIGDFWFADAYPADAVVVPIDARTGDLAVYRKTDQAFLMLGLASEEEDVTALVYDPPVTILAFPFQKGSTWQTLEARADGLFEGSVYPDAYGNHVVHTYEFVVNGRGQVTVPAGTFPAFRLLLDLTMEARNLWGIPYEIPGLAETKRVKVYDFLAECVGLVARVRSTDGELATFFDQATEYKRLGF